MNPHVSSTDAITIRGLSKVYQGKRGVKKAVEDISFSIKRGTIYGILGPNGAGKSTIINIISGIINKTSGEILMDGEEISKNPEYFKRKIGTAVQEIMLDPFFSVKEYLEFTAGYYGLSGVKRKERIEEVCEALSLTPHFAKHTRMLSGGMKRRLVIAKALLHDPEIIILDEPTAGVDIELRTSLWNYVRKLNEQGKTIILTTHYLKEAEQFCDRIAFINEGKIVMEDTKDSILQHINTKKLILTFEGRIEMPTLSGCSIKENGNTVEITYNPILTDIGGLLSQFDTKKIRDISSVEPTLDDIFLSIFKSV
jgi:ABC-2 type transport system ATP-binding protein